MPIKQSSDLIYKEVCRCPYCGSKRITKLPLNECYCRACSTKFTVKVLPIAICPKCGKNIIDEASGIKMGNGSIKHKRCKQKKHDNFHKL